MAELPLLIFPKATEIEPITKRSSRLKPHLPFKSRQAERIDPMLDDLQQQFAADSAILTKALPGVEPEFVLVIETAGRIDKLQRAVENTIGLDWLAEWDDLTESDDDFYSNPRIGKTYFKNKIESIENNDQSDEIRKILQQQQFLDHYWYLTDNDLLKLDLPKHLSHLKQEIIGAINSAVDAGREKSLNGRVILTMTSQRGLSELLTLWRMWKDETPLPTGKGKWKDVFEHLKDIRRWGPQEQLIETGVLSDWENSLKEGLEKSVRFTLELFYRKTARRRKDNEAHITKLIASLDGRLISPFLVMEDIGFHAVKVALPLDAVRQIVDKARSGNRDIALLLFQDIMFYRATGQAFVTMAMDTELVPAPPDAPVSGDPVVAILDGVPFSEHAWLKNRLIVDDADNLEAEYQPGEKKHGTAMASLVVHGEMDANEQPVTRPVYFRPIMQADKSSRQFRFREHVPEDIFYEDRIARAVRRMFEGEGETPAQASSIKIINLSVADHSRPFGHTLSPWARLLDWLSWKYKVLFCVSMGNYDDEINLGDNEFQGKSDEEKIEITLKLMGDQSDTRRLLSPSESINSITVGACHSDESDIRVLGNRVDVLPDSTLPSPINRLGYGFRRSIKPEVLFSGGRQFYTSQSHDGEIFFRPDGSISPPGQKVASEGSTVGEESGVTYTRGTSNATALATRAGAKIFDVIEAIRQEQPGNITDDQVAILIKTLLVHGANKSDSFETLEAYLKPLAPAKKFKEYLSKYVGYGTVDVNRVLHCTTQRATVIGCGTITPEEVHEYHFPLPPSLVKEKYWRKLTITLSWITPINSNHQYIRQAALSFEPPKDDDCLRLKRSEVHGIQAKRGTIQHEILEGKKASDYQIGEFLTIPVKCRADATANLDDPIDYALAVTLEVKENIDIPIYQEIRAGIQTPIKVA